MYKLKQKQKMLQIGGNTYNVKHSNGYVERITIRGNTFRQTPTYGHLHGEISRKYFSKTHSKYKIVKIVGEELIFTIDSNNITEDTTSFFNNSIGTDIMIVLYHSVYIVTKVDGTCGKIMIDEEHTYEKLHEIISKTYFPSGDPSGNPSGDPSGNPSGDPSGDPSGNPSGDPSYLIKKIRPNNNYIIVSSDFMRQKENIKTTEEITIILGDTTDFDLVMSETLSIKIDYTILNSITDNINDTNIFKNINYLIWRYLSILDFNHAEIITLKNKLLYLKYKLIWNIGILLEKLLDMQIINNVSNAYLFMIQLDQNHILFLKKYFQKLKSLKLNSNSNYLNSEQDFKSYAISALRSGKWNIIGFKSDQNGRVFSFQINVENLEGTEGETTDGSKDTDMCIRIFKNIGTNTQKFETKITKKHLALIIIDEINKGSTYLESMFDFTNRTMTFHVNCAALS